KTQYSLYALTYLAKKYKNGPVLINEIAQAEKLPKKFLETILLELKNTGIVSSKKGKGGGYYLIKKPENVNFAEIIRLFDGAIALLPCVTYNYYEACDHCKNENLCGIRAVVKEIRDKTVAILKKTTLKDVIDMENLLKS
ncbi:MAG: transcriptional regulator, partial [Bacteroidetes bacterium CG23_combo_of_CG06-09_8_20_14_all_32_9]